MTLALIRFVNSLLDPLQKRDKSLPLSVLAVNTGLPTAFVEVRHWGTHENNLPGPEVLKNMGIRALEWLWRNYWNKEDEEVNVFAQWKNGQVSVDEVVETINKHDEEVFEKLVGALSEDENFSALRMIWEPLISSLSIGLLGFPDDFLDYTIDTLTATSNGIVYVIRH